MLKSFETRGMSAGSFYKILFLGNFVWLLITAIVLGVIGWAMPHSIYAFGQHEYAFMGGFLGLVIAVVLSPIYAAFVALAQWIFIGFGFWLWTRFKTVNLCISVVKEGCCDTTKPGCATDMHDHHQH